MGVSATGVEQRTPYEEALNQYREKEWGAALVSLRPSIHEVDRAATEIWFAFFPLGLLRALERAEDPEKLARQLSLEGKYYLRDQIDSSHRFLYGHRYWPEVKAAVLKQARTASRITSLEEDIRDAAKQLAAGTGTSEPLLLGITAVAFMTLEQVGIEAFAASPGKVSVDPSYARRSPEQVLRERAKDDSQGLLGFLKTVDKLWTVTFDEGSNEGKYRMRHMQDLASGAANDSRDWRAQDPRCMEGPIPVQCRSAACGTCWIGVLGGAEKLSEVGRLESRKIKEFGYIDTTDPKPLIRLACQAQAHGAVSIVIPPWNGITGRFLKEQSKETVGE